MHYEVLEYVQGKARAYGPFKSVLEIGGRNVNGSVRDFFPGAFYWATDVTDGPGVNEVVDFAERPTSSTEHWDCIVCTEVLEHAPRADLILANAFAHLADKGVLILTMANERRQPHSAYLESPAPGVIAPPGPDEFYRGVTYPMLLDWLRSAGFECMEVDNVGTDLQAIAWKGLVRSEIELDESLPADLRKLMEQS